MKFPPQPHCGWGDFCATVKCPVLNYDTHNPEDHLQFLLSVGQDQPDEIVTYNQLMDLLHHEVDGDIEDDMWIFKDIIGHEGPLSTTHANYKGSKYNVKVQWESGEQTFEPLHIIGADSPAMVAKYGLDNNLLDLPGWKRFRRLAHRQKKILR